MSDVFDVAKYILKKIDGTTAMKLQKLVYYSQAWSLVWDDAPMYSEKIEAWANGPVVRELYETLRGRFNVSEKDLRTLGDVKALSPTEIETIDAMLEFYGQRKPQYLSDLTHHENPWKNARSGLDPLARSSQEITHADMVEYYSSL